MYISNIFLGCVITWYVRVTTVFLSFMYIINIIIIINKTKQGATKLFKLDLG